MFKQGFVAVLLAAMMLVQSPGGVWARDGGNERNEQRDTKSRHETAALNHVPLVLTSKQTMQIASIILVMQQLTYLSLASAGVDVTDQNRVNLGGLGFLGSIFSKVYGPDDFGADNDVGTVFRAGKDKLVIALKDDLKLEDYQVIIFNTNNQYTVQGRPTIQQAPPQNLAALGTLAIINQLMLHALAPEGMKLLGNLNIDPEADQRSAQNIGVDLVTEMPVLQEHVVGRAYLGPNNTILVVVRPATVVGDGG